MKARKQQMSSTPGSPAFRPDSFKNRFTPTARPISRNKNEESATTTSTRKDSENGNEKVSETNGNVKTSSHVDKVNLIRPRKPSSSQPTPSPRPDSSQQKTSYLSSMFSTKNNDNAANGNKEENDNLEKIGRLKSRKQVPGEGPKSPIKTAHPRVPRKSSTDDEAASPRSPARSSPRKSSAVR